MRVVEHLLLKPSSPIEWRSWVSVERLNDMHHALRRRAADQEVRHVLRDSPVNQSLGAAEPSRF